MITGEKTAEQAERSSGDDVKGLPLLRLEHVSKHFDMSSSWATRFIRRGSRRWLRAVDNVSFEIPRGCTVSLVGESGCGKSTIARLVVGLYEASGGRVFFDEMDRQAVTTSAERRRQHRRVQMIFQDPYASLNSRWQVGRIVAEPLNVFGLCATERERRQRVAELLSCVGLSPVDAGRYPHQFSGGQRQRISIARALASGPELLVCDEPTSALDVSVQAQILNLMKRLQRQLHLTYLFISHDLAVIRYVSDFIGVMYLGRLVEWNATETLFEAPRHPYTRMLLNSIPSLDPAIRASRAVIGEVANPMDPPSGCHFHPRCSYADDQCRREIPIPLPINGGTVRCHAVAEGRIN